MKDIELQTEAFKRYIQECDELSITPDYASAFNAAWNACAAVEADRAQRVPDDFLSHKSAWRAALVIAQGFSANEDDSAYWSHEIKAFDRAYARLLASTPAPAQQSGWTEESGLVIDFANRVELSCYDQGSAECMAAVQQILDGKDRGDGVANEPWESIRRRLIYLVAPAPAQQEPDCPMCKGSGEDPEGYFDQSRGPDGDTHDGPCRDCAGTGAAPQPVERKPMTYREIADATSEWAHVRSDYTIGIIRAVESHHGIKE